MFYVVVAPVKKFTTFRLLLSIAAAQNRDLEQVNMKTVLLNGELEEEIYLEPPSLL